MASLEDMREWPPTTVLKLFELVKQHPILYDSKHGNWTNTTEKGRIWTAIAKELDPNLTSKKCRDRFQYNKKKHVNDIRKQIALGDNTNVNMDLIWLFDQHDEEKENHTNGKATDATKSDSPTNDHENDTESGIHSHESDEEAASANRQVPAGLTLMDFINQIPIAVETDSSDGEPPSKRRKRKDSSPTKLEEISEQAQLQQGIQPPCINNNNFLAEFLSSLQTIQDQQRQKQVEAECSTFGRQVEIDLRRLDSKNRAKARLAITSILSELYQQQQQF